MKKNTGSTAVALVITFGVMLLIGAIMKASEPKCSMSGCNDERISGSRYCVMHDLSYRSYGNPDYHAVYKASQQRRKNTVTNKDYSVQTSGITSKSTSSYTPKRSTYSRTKKSYSEKNYDPYDAEEYDNADDFAEEWAEEFGDGDYDEGYDDAYDYWEERD